MTDKQAKIAQEWKTTVLKDWPSRLVLTTLTAFSAYAYTHADEVIKRKIIETMKPAMDSLSDKVDSTAMETGKVNDKLDALISVMSDAFPEFKKAAKERAQENRDSEEIQDALTGGNP